MGKWGSCHQSVTTRAWKSLWENLWEIYGKLTQTTLGQVFPCSSLSPDGHGKIYGKSHGKLIPPTQNPHQLPVKHLLTKTKPLFNKKQATQIYLTQQTTPTIPMLKSGSRRAWKSSWEKSWEKTIQQLTQKQSELTAESLPFSPKKNKTHQKDQDASFFFRLQPSYALHSFSL